VFILVSPTIVTSGQEFVTDRSISLHCHAVGVEPPTITWQYSDGKQIVNTSTTIISEIDAERSFLTLTVVSSVYEFEPFAVECVATNDFGTATHNISKFYFE